MWTVYILPHISWQLHSLKILESVFNVVSPAVNGALHLCSLQACLPPSLPPQFLIFSSFSPSTPTFHWQHLLNSMLEFILLTATPQVLSSCSLAPKPLSSHFPDQPGIRCQYENRSPQHLGSNSYSSFSRKWMQQLATQLHEGMWDVMEDDLSTGRSLGRYYDFLFSSGTLVPTSRSL